jgi:hypothetical protein
MAENRNKEAYVEVLLTRSELELIADLIYNYEQNFHDRRAENHALGTKVDNAIEDLEITEYLKDRKE